MPSPAPAAPAAPAAPLPSHRGVSRASRRPRGAGTVVVALLVAAIAAPAAAAPTSRDLRDELEVAQARLDELEGIVGRVVEDYNEAAEALGRLEGEVATTSERIATARAEAEVLRADAAMHVRRIHKLGPTLEVASLVATASPLDAGARAIVLRRIVDGQQADLARLSTLTAELERDERLLIDQRDEARRRTDVLEARRATVEETIAAHAEEVRELEERLRAAVSAEERARREAERRRIAAAAAAALSSSSSSTSGGTSGTSGSTSGTTGGGTTTGGSTGSGGDTAPRAGAEVAVQAALSKLGAPYQWGATGPDTFDCSGLIVWAWRQAGVSLPRTSREQFATLRSITRAELRPGDLVFAGYPDVHHVGMYIGDGLIVHAPYTGAVVSIRSMERADLRGFARVG